MFGTTDERGNTMAHAKGLATRLDASGAVIGLVLLTLSLTPSLIPRPSWGQGLVSGVVFAIGYGIGVLVWRLAARVSRGNLPSTARVRAWIVVVIGVVGIVAIMPFATDWQNSVREAALMPPATGFHWGTALVTFIVGAWLSFAIGRGIGGSYAFLSSRIGARMPARADRPRVTATATVGITVVAMLVAFALLLSVATWLLTLSANHSNRQYDPSYSQPTSPLRSGSPASLVAWEDIGQAGVKIVAGGPTVEQIAQVTGVPAVEPIRVYVGLDAADTFEEQAAIAVAELDRTGAGDRSVLLIGGTSGSGWVDPAGLDGFEYLHAGDTATVVVQFGATSSTTSAVLTPSRATDANRALIDAVTDWWRDLPADSRPQVVLYGVSLGSYGLQGAFEDMDDMLASTQGAVLAGTPSITPIWAAAQDARDEGSTVTLPVLDDGRHVRWADEWGGLGALDGPWEDTRIAYLQHGNDAIVWISPDVIWAYPEWLREDQRSDAVSDDMVWIPVVTALQGVIDMVLSTTVPEDAGHMYGNLSVDALHQVTGDAGLSDEAVARIRTVIEQYDVESPVAN